MATLSSPVNLLKRLCASGSSTCGTQRNEDDVCANLSETFGLLSVSTVSVLLEKHFEIDGVLLQLGIRYAGRGLAAEFVHSSECLRGEKLLQEGLTDSAGRSETARALVSAQVDAKGTCGST